jgi:nucleoside-diphosphate-sugar epimerase
MPVSLVIGGSGQIGRFLIPKLLDAGHDVLALSRQLHVSAHPQLRWIHADLNAFSPELLKLDVIFSLGPLDAFAAWLNREPAIEAQRVIAFGSMSAVSKQHSPDPTERALAETLRASEQELIAWAEARRTTWIVFRPTMIYGAGIDRSLTPLAKLARRTRIFPMLSAARGLRQPVHAEDLACACLAAARRTSNSSAIYELGGGEVLSFAEMMSRLRASLNTPTLGLPIGMKMAQTLLLLAHLHPRWRGIHTAALARLQKDLLADNAAAIADFDWQPRGFRPTASTWISNETI